MYQKEFQKIAFLISVPKPVQAPADTGTEVAFAGRSNAGKSSALNAITQRKALARISKTPGRTQHLVFFKLDDSRRLVDLPGYGFAKVPTRVKREWGDAMTNYFEQRKSLRGLILLMDVRHPLTDFDQQMLAWCNSVNMKVHILLTKSDKLKKGPAKATLLQVQKELAAYGTVSIQLFSATKKIGVEQAQSLILNWLNAEPISNG
ncbi:MAG: ribosome biogenesis GTP-binding protein YihA/YsxC [Thiohalomonadales bacterium]